MIARSKTSLNAGCIVAGCLVATLFLGTAYVSVAAESPPTLDQLLTQAMDENPGIVAMKAKVAMAEADLRNIRFEVAWKLVVCRNEVEAQQRAVGLARERLALMAEANKRAAATVGLQELQAAKNTLIDAEAKLARARSELQFLIGQSPSAVFAPSASSSVPTALRAPLQIPHGPTVERIREDLGATTQMEFLDQPLSDVVAYLKDLHRIEIQIDGGALEDAGLNSDMPITLNIKGIRLGAALQLLDDKLRDLKWVVRDYGILVTTPERAQEAGYMPVVEFARLVGVDAVPTAAGKKVSESAGTEGRNEKAWPDPFK